MISIDTFHSSGPTDRPTDDVNTKIRGQFVFFFPFNSSYFIPFVDSGDPAFDGSSVGVAVVRQIVRQLHQELDRFSGFSGFEFELVVFPQQLFRLEGKENIELG